MKSSSFQLILLFSVYLCWSLDVALLDSQSWRVWEFENDEIHTVFIGLWGAFYFQKFNISGSMVTLPMHRKFNSSWIIPEEIWYGQDLMLLTICMKSVALVFASQSLMVSWLRAPYPDFIRWYGKISAAFLLFSSCCTATAVSWNFAVEFYGQTTLEFPESFPLKREMLTKKVFSHLFLVGIFSVTLSLICAIIIYFKSHSVNLWFQAKSKSVRNSFK